MGGPISYDPAVAIPTLIGSLLSCLASGSIFLCYIFLPQIPHFRHVLIINLAASDFINSLNNSISGIYVFSVGKLSPGGLCTANGFIGQISVQATDFAILLVACATVFGLRGNTGGLDVGWKSKVILSSCVWFMPVITSFTALGLRAYAPVSGNWCWIAQDKPVLRYALTHGWRFAIVLTTIILYIYLFFYFRAHFRTMRDIQRPSHAEVSAPMNLKPFPQYNPDDDDDDNEFEMRDKESTFKKYDPNDDSVPISSSKALTNITSYQQTLTSPSNNTSYAHKRKVSVHRKQSEIQKVLLLNAYPIAYVLLWLPGLINRMVELSGSSSRPLQIMQSTSQFVGLANAITYGYNEGIKRQLDVWWKKRKGLLSGSSNSNGSFA